MSRCFFILSDFSTLNVTTIVPGVPLNSRVLSIPPGNLMSSRALKGKIPLADTTLT